MVLENTLGNICSSAKKIDIQLIYSLMGDFIDYISFSGRITFIV
jgi:hypothetical protein